MHNKGKHCHSPLMSKLYNAIHPLTRHNNMPKVKFSPQIPKICYYCYNTVNQ